VTLKNVQIWAQMKMTKQKVVKFDEASEFFFHEGCFILEILNTPDDPEVSIARARLEPGKTTKFHALKGVSERYLIQEGQGVINVGDLPEQRLLKGDVVVIPAGIRQRIFNPGPKPLVFLAICTPRFSPECYQDLESD
jgi:mannose-6-phosphate isomerase-like protein (cupin superfamily)